MFHTKGTVQRIEPFDDVTLVRNNERYTIKLQHPESILFAAWKQGILSPYSCEMAAVEIALPIAGVYYPIEGEHSIRC